MHTVLVCLLMVVGLSLCVVLPEVLGSKARHDREAQSQALGQAVLRACSTAAQSTVDARAKLVEIISSENQLAVSAEASAQDMAQMLAGYRLTMTPQNWTKLQAVIAPKIEEAQQTARSARLGVQVYQNDMTSVEARGVKVERICERNRNSPD